MINIKDNSLKKTIYKKTEKSNNNNNNKFKKWNNPKKPS